GRLAWLQDPDAFKTLVRALYEKEWIVYAKAPFGGPGQVLKYLSRYTHRVAISNGRLVGMDQESVSFTWKDYAHGCKQRLMRLRGAEFLRRFLLHVLPKGLVRIRHSGFLSNAKRTRSIERCRELLASTQAAHEERPAHATVDVSALPCPECKAGHMRMIYRFDPGEEPRALKPRAADT
ncbi:MAG TPA: transposase, partial [Terrimesophilobacter sp.]|nr:transposase [Terrimesophilobacter sp.]